MLYCMRRTAETTMIFGVVSDLVGRQCLAHPCVVELVAARASNNLTKLRRPTRRLAVAKIRRSRDRQMARHAQWTIGKSEVDCIRRSDPKIDHVVWTPTPRP